MPFGSNGQTWSRVNCMSDRRLFIVTHETLLGAPTNYTGAFS